MRHSFVAGRVTYLAGLAAASLGSGIPAAADDVHATGDRLGTVNFSVNCAAAAQEGFTRSMALYHSFAWSQAMEAFKAVSDADPNCGMAHWGRAMVMLDNPFLWPGSLTPEKLGDIAVALEDARKAGLHDEREKAYVAALEAFVRDRDTLDHRARVRLLEDAMGEVAAANPEDTEASILHALITSANFDPTDQTYSNQMRAAKILEPLFAKHPDHPGVAHYLIHTYDYPPLAEQGLKAASSYAKIAPDATHALHMPSHIFTRVGQWQASIDSNSESAKVDGGKSLNTHHAYDYKVYAHLQLAQDGAAKEAIDEAFAANQVDHFATAFAYAAMPARVSLERGDWGAAKDLDLKPATGDYPWEKYPHAEAINAFARGVGAARSGDAKAAKEQQARLEKLRDATGPDYWVEQVNIQADIVGALALCAEDRAQGCIHALSKAAAREDATQKHVVTPGPILPAREILADILLEQDRAEEALIEYEAVLGKEPNRYRALAGAMEAAEKANNMEKARSQAKHLIEQAAATDSERSSLELARRIVSAQ
jgi:hypothetical protein